jgi:hypothetical protein
MDLPWREAVIAVLKKSSEAMHYIEISDEVANLGLRKALGASPARTVSAVITTSIRDEGEASPFIKEGSGYYKLRVQENVSQPSEDPTRRKVKIIQSFGMYWFRDDVLWKSKSILGQQHADADVVNFYDQRGVYLLHDRDKVVYVGRSVDRPLGLRLKEHIRDRHRSRWERFSWFGLYGVSEDGRLVKEEVYLDEEAIITAFESILMESLEAPRNNRRGDYLNDAEFVQVRDPEIDKRLTREILQRALANLD